MISWIILSLIVGTVVVLAHACFDLAARTSRHPRRFIWAQAMGMVVLLPIALSRMAASRTLPSIDMSAIAQRLNVVEVLSTTGAAHQGSTSRWIIIGWIALSALLIVRHAVALRRLSILRRQWARASIDGVRVEVSANTGPAVVGLRDAAIVVPAWFASLPDEERRLVLAHEAQHIAEDDHVLLWWARFLAVLVPWHPAIWYANHRLRLAVEEDCDARVLGSGASPVAYADTLVNVAQRAQGRQPVLAPALLEPASSLSRRITAMFAPPARFPRVVSIGATAAGVALFIVGCMTREPTGAKPVKASDPLVITATRTASTDGRDSVYFEYQVQNPVRQLPGGMAPRYPDSLRAAGVQGEVLAQFIVNPDGKADLATWKVLKASHEQFANAVYAALPGMTYTPASKDGRVVRQLVQQPFSFAIARQ